MNRQQSIKVIADLILNELNAFEQNFKVKVSSNQDVYAYSGDNFSQGSKQKQALADIQQKNYIAQTQLLREPFIAYVKTLMDGEARKLFICRGQIPLSYNPKEENSDFVNYMSPLGRAIEEEVGSEFPFRIKNNVGKWVAHSVRILEKNEFRPIKTNDSTWDGINDKISLSYGTFSIESLLKFLEEYSEIEQHVRGKEQLEKIKEQEKYISEQISKKLKMEEGIQKGIVKKFALRDQPTLNKYQGEIFRLPVSSQLIISGAPGTGKTTTLIKRIAQKTVSEYLSDDEKARLSGLDLQNYFNDDNWVMFTPTELLKIYLKEAFAKTGVAASDHHVKIWDEERRFIARDILKILKVVDSGVFMPTKKGLLKNIENSELIKYSEQFRDALYNYIISEALNSATVIKANGINQERFSDIIKIVGQIKVDSVHFTDSMIIRLIEQLSRSRDLVLSLSNLLNEEIDKITDSIIVSEPEILENIYSVISIYKEERVREDENSDEISEENEESEPNYEGKDPDVEARGQLKRTVSWYAARLVRKQKAVQKGLNFEVYNQIKSLLPNEDQMVNLGKHIIDRRAVNRITQGYTNLLNRIPQFYRKFRLEQLKKGKSFYNNEAESDIKDKRISYPEIDMLIFFMLKNARIIFNRKPTLLHHNSKNAVLEEIKSIYKTQVTVDEATDFSSIQLGAMYYLAHPRFKSVSFSGDVMQRITQYGIKNWNELKFFYDGFQIKNVDMVYRQSERLLKIAKKLYENALHVKPEFISAYSEKEIDQKPLKFDAHNDEQRLAEWIAERIAEIYKMYNNFLPSIAVFVANDAQIPSLEERLEEALAEYSIGVKGCPRGEILSSDGKVRIFSVEYIKGLEFESVFFVNIEHISEVNPDLIDKYLYVGVTRAAQFLAVTYNDYFPDSLKFIEDSFVEEDWNMK